MDKNNLFRKSALERLSTPEQLDTLMQLVSPQSWLILLGLVLLVGAAMVWSIVEEIPTTVSVQGLLIAQDEESNLGGELESDLILAEFDGIVTEVRATAGAYVEDGQTLVVITQDGTQQEIASPTSGLVVSIAVEPDDRISNGVLLGEVLPFDLDDNIPIEVVAYVSLYSAQYLELGMPVEVLPLNISEQDYGFLHGTIQDIGQYPSTTTLARTFMTNDIPVVEVLVALQPDETTASGYAWSIGSGPDRKLQVGVVAEVNIIVDRQRPIERILPILGLNS